jgi:hypothetical protein
LLLLSLLLLALPGRADIAATWNGTSGNWTDASRWSTAPVFPNNNAPNFYDAFVSVGTVALDQNIAINQLTLGGALTGSFTLTLAEGIAWNGGSIALTGGGRVQLGNGAASNVTGAASFTSGQIVGGGSATLNIPAGATLTALSDASFSPIPRIHSGR